MKTDISFIEIDARRCPAKPNGAEFLFATEDLRDLARL